jgi:hypothetical protein
MSLSRQDVPAFARGFPENDLLDELVLAFQAGDYAKVRRDAPRIASASDDDEVKRAAQELVRRTRADPLMKWLLVFTGALLLTLSGYWMTR